MIDTASLLAFLDSRAETRSPLVRAIYEALAQRIRRGDFDQDHKEDI